VPASTFCTRLDIMRAAASAARHAQRASRRSLATMRDRLNDLGNQMPQQGPPSGLIGAAAGVGAVGFVGYNSFFTVQGGERAVLWSRVQGVKPSVYGEGMHPRIPLIEYPVHFDVRSRGRNVQSLTGSKDLQMVNIQLRVLFYPNKEELPWIYTRLGHNYDDRVLPSIVNEVTKAVVARYNASDLLTKREVVSNEIRNALTQRMAEFRILLDDFMLTQISFSNEYTSAVEAKQVAQQDAERARYVVEKAIQEKRSIIVKAEGEAESARLIGKAIQNNPGFVKLRKIDTAKEIAVTVSRNQGKVYLNSDSLLINVLGDADLADEKKGKWR
jgi:prohibitin 2